MVSKTVFAAVLRAGSDRRPSRSVWNYPAGNWACAMPSGAIRRGAGGCGGEGKCAFIDLDPAWNLEGWNWSHKPTAPH
jgi:hypothetical protein